MLYNIACNLSDNDFYKIVEVIRNAYWPEEKYYQNKEDLPAWSKPPTEDERLSQTETALRDITKKICYPDNDSEGPYTTFVWNEINKELKFTSNMVIPFLDRFHTLFLKRKYDAPFRDPEWRIRDLIRLEKPDSLIDGNYSKNFGNYNHFINVVMATARLINYFKEIPNFISTLGPSEKMEAEKPSFSYDTLVYKSQPNRRTFKLMLAAFYHDIGKTVIGHRHGMEGAFIIADHNLKALNQLENIFSQYPTSQIFERDDLLEISDFLYYHDFFGTLGTGESSYMLLSNILDKFKRYSMRHIEDKDKQKNYSKKSLFDLWILNIADIMVSVKDKGIFQKSWLDSDTSINMIEKFFKREGGKNRVHDLKLAYLLLENINHSTHTDDLSEIEQLAHKYSQNHTVERIRRLILCTLKPELVKVKDRINDELKKEPTYKNNISSLIDQTLDDLSDEIKFTNGFVSLIILRCIQCVGNSKEFCDKLSWIGSMDYALGFFQNIIAKIIEKTEKELNSDGKITGWYHETVETMSDADKGKINLANTTALLENYTAIVIRILSYLLFRERSIDKLSNIEFEDTRERLTDEKINKIIALEGPYKANKSIELILKTIFVY